MCSFLSIQPLNTSLCFKCLYSNPHLCQRCSVVSTIYIVSIGNSWVKKLFLVKTLSAKLSDLSPNGSVSVTSIAEHLPAGQTQLCIIVPDVQKSEYCTKHTCQSKSSRHDIPAGLEQLKPSIQHNLQQTNGLSL